MITSQNGIALVKDFEGFRGKAYRCPAGVWTIGYGFTDGVKEGDTITREQADKRLVSELGYFEQVVNKHVKVALNQNQFDALVSFVFNVGEGNKYRDGFVRLKNGKPSSLLKAINTGRFEDAPALFAQWNKVKGKPSTGLTRRRTAEAALFMKTSDAEEMPQAVDSPNKSLIKSKTMANASVAGGVGVALAVAPAIEPAGQIVEIAQNNTQGFLLVLGVVIIAFAAVAAFIRYTDRNKL